MLLASCRQQRPDKGAGFQQTQGLLEPQESRTCLSHDSPLKNLQSLLSVIQGAAVCSDWRGASCADQELAVRRSPSQSRILFQEDSLKSLDLVRLSEKLGRSSRVVFLRCSTRLSFQLLALPTSARLPVYGPASLFVSLPPGYRSSCLSPDLFKFFR